MLSTDIRMPPYLLTKPLCCQLNRYAANHACIRQALSTDIRMPPSLSAISPLAKDLIFSLLQGDAKLRVTASQANN